MTVWAVNIDHQYDTSPALQYGDIRHINLRYVYGDEIQNEQMPEETRNALVRAAYEFKPGDDYLLVVGDHLQLLKFASELGRVWGGFRVLRWDKKANGYLVCWV